MSESVQIPQKLRDKGITSFSTNLKEGETIQLKVGLLAFFQKELIEEYVVDGDPLGPAQGDGSNAST